MRGGGLPAGTKSRRVRGHGGQGAPPSRAVPPQQPRSPPNPFTSGCFFFLMEVPLGMIG